MRDLDLHGRPGISSTSILGRLQSCQPVQANLIALGNSHHLRGVLQWFLWLVLDALVGDDIIQSARELPVLKSDFPQIDQS